MQFYHLHHCIQNWAWRHSRSVWMKKWSNPDLRRTVNIFRPFVFLPHSCCQYVAPLLLINSIKRERERERGPKDNKLWGRKNNFLPTLLAGLIIALTRDRFMGENKQTYYAHVRFHTNMGPSTGRAVKVYTPPWAKEKGRVWFGTSKGRQAIHMEIEKPMFGK